MECPCGSKQPFDICCAPYIAGTPAPTAEALMRSRYSAYCLGKLDYVERTCTGPAAKSFNRRDAELSQLGTQWLGLEIKGRQRGRETDNDGTVKFTFRYRHNGQEHAHTELSHFIRTDGAWFYDHGDVKLQSNRTATAQIGRNDPCPCRSGKKYKKCCGADA